MDTVILALRVTWPVDWGLLMIVTLVLAGLVGLSLLVVLAMALTSGKKKKGVARRRAAPSAGAPPGQAWLWVRSGPGAGAHHPVAHTTVLMGSAPEAQISVPHPQVAAHHASLSRRESGFVLQDLGSQTGTFVNGHQITAAVWVQAGDVIRLGDAVELMLQV